MKRWQMAGFGYTFPSVGMISSTPFKEVRLICCFHAPVFFKSNLNEQVDFRAGLLTPSSSAWVQLKFLWNHYPLSTFKMDCHKTKLQSKQNEVKLVFLKDMLLVQMRAQNHMAPLKVSPLLHGLPAHPKSMTLWRTQSPSGQRATWLAHR